MSHENDYLGLTKTQALAKAKAAGLRARIFMEDGQYLPVTKDYRIDRLNFAITKGNVTQVTKG